MEAQKEEERAYTFVNNNLFDSELPIWNTTSRGISFFFLYKKKCKTIAASMHWCFIIDFINVCCLDAVNMIGF